MALQRERKELDKGFVLPAAVCIYVRVCLPVYLFICILDQGRGKVILYIYFFSTLIKVEIHPYCVD